MHHKCMRQNFNKFRRRFKFLVMKLAFIKFYKFAFGERNIIWKFFCICKFLPLYSEASSWKITERYNQKKFDRNGVHHQIHLRIEEYYKSYMKIGVFASFMRFAIC